MRQAVVWNGLDVLELDVVGSLSTYAKDINEAGQVLDMLKRAMARYLGMGSQCRNWESWLLTRAAGINNNGQIIGTGLFHGAQREYLLSPIDAPGTPAAVPLPAAVAMTLGVVPVFMVARKRFRKTGPI